MLLNAFRCIFEQKDIFHIEKKLMKPWLWPGDNLINKKYLTIYILNYFCVVFPLLTYFFTTTEEFFEIAIGICEMIQYTVYNVKVICILYNRHELKKLVENLAKGWNYFKTSPAKEVREFHDKTVQKSFYVILIFGLLAPPALFIYFYIPLLIDLAKILMGKSDLSMRMILKADFYFVDPEHNGFTFIIYTIISRIYINYFIFSFYMMDLFLIILFFYVASFIEGLNMKLHVLVIDKDLTKRGEQNDIKMINEIIQDHIFALDLVKSLERVVAPIMLCQFVLFSYSFCFLMFNFTMIIDKLSLLASLLSFFLVTQSQQFIFSYLGDKITDECASFGFHAYNLHWYNRSPEVQKVICVMIHKAQILTGITAGKFYVIDLDTYGKIILSSINYFTIIKSVYSET